MQYLVAFLCILISIETFRVWRSILRERLVQSVLEHADSRLILLTVPRSLKPLQGLPTASFIVFLLILTASSLVLVFQPADGFWECFERIIPLGITSGIIIQLVNWVLRPLHFIITPESFCSLAFHDSAFSRNNVEIPWNRIRSFSYYDAFPDMLVLVFETEEKRSKEIRTGGLAPEHLATIEIFARRAIGAAGKPRPPKGKNEPCNI